MISNSRAAVSGLILLCLSFPASSQTVSTQPDAESPVTLASLDREAHRASISKRSVERGGFTQAYGNDPYGFAALINYYRARAGLPPVAYDENLSAWAARNNMAQCRRGLGHHINPNVFQNCGWNYESAMEVAQGWMRSPGHRSNMLSPSITRFGIAYGPGPYWTMNAR